MNIVKSVSNYFWPEKFNHKVLECHLKSGVIRLNMRSEKNKSEIHQLKKQIVKYAEDPSKESSIEHSAKRIYTISRQNTAMNLLSQHFEILSSYTSMMQTNCRIPFDVIPQAATVILVAPYLNIEEMQHIQHQFKLLLGEDIYQTYALLNRQEVDYKAVDPFFERESDQSRLEVLLIMDELVPNRYQEQIGALKDKMKSEMLNMLERQEQSNMPQKMEGSSSNVNNGNFGQPNFNPNGGYSMGQGNNINVDTNNNQRYMGTYSGFKDPNTYIDPNTYNDPNTYTDSNANFTMNQTTSYFNNPQVSNGMHPNSPTSFPSPNKNSPTGFHSPNNNSSTGFHSPNNNSPSHLPYVPTAPPFP